MAKQIQDPGLGSKYRPGEKRLMNKDGSFNVKKIGAPGNIRDFYQTLIKMTWVKFFALIFAFIITLNLLFALTYVLIGVEHLVGDHEGDFWQNLSEAFFFSFQTFTTVGYGHIAPVGKLTNFIAVFESATGLMVFAVITGLLYGRFSRPSMRLLFSNKALIAPYKEDGWGLMFRVVNLRKSTLLEIEASVALTLHIREGNENKRKYYRLNLEIDKIEYFPAAWTIVHPLDDKSLFNAIDIHNLANEDMEVIIQLKAFDDTFSQHVHARNSYTSSEIIVGAKFRPASRVDDDGNLIIPLDEFHDYDLVNYP
jgi:inward rectifier potassium channel